MSRPPLLVLLAWLPAVAAAATIQAGAGLPAAPGEAAAMASIVLQAPMTTVVRLEEALSGGDQELVAELEVPADAPDDLGVSAFAGDRHGRWFQTAGQGPLGPGRHRLRFALGPRDRLVSEPGRRAWNADEAWNARRGGIILWSASASRAALAVRLRIEAVAPAAPPGARLLDLQLDGAGDAGRLAGATGARWTASVRPDPFPANPYDAEEFSLDALVTAPDGTILRIPGFHQQPFTAADGGDREVLHAAGAGTFCVRLRPRQPGLHQVTLEARWRDGRRCGVTLPPLHAAGAAWDGYARVDRGDPRFLSADGALVWPLGPNLHSITDVRGRRHLGTRPTADRGTLSYRHLFDRLAAAGGTAAEVWMSSWNLALEWRADWPGFQGLGRYSQDNAWRLDRILDLAWERGIRVNLVINNHGQASRHADPEWASNPWNRVQGGPLDQPSKLFTDPLALAGQQQLRRYLVARYADHPAVLGWKLWSEVNLTDGHQHLAAWHAEAAARWHALDVYGHGVTTHWCGDYTAVDRVVASQPGIDYACIDAYHGRGRAIAQLLWDSTLDPGRGLARLGKPVLVTEFGCNWDTGPEAQMIAEHAVGPWAGLVSGHAGSPMLWWSEWIDQRDRWSAYSGPAAFLAGEDLRSRPDSAARSVALTATSAGGLLWVRAWSRPGRMLGYLLDTRWGIGGDNPAEHSAASVLIGEDVAPGGLIVQWWDADRGLRLAIAELDHRGGRLALAPPPFARHLAFKLIRVVGR